MIRRFGIVIFLIMVVCIVYGQTITVKDKLSQKPLDAVAIIDAVTGEFQLTDKNGEADLSSMKNSGVISFQLLGYVQVESAFSDLATSGFELQMEREDVMLDQVVVAATKWRQGRKDVPVKITSIAAQEVALKNPQSSADLLGLSGEVFIQKSQQGGGSPMIRGFSANRLLYSVDGVRMNTAIFRSGNLHNVISLDPFSVENAEVVFGPGSVIYGSDAIGGVMSFQTISPRFADTAQTNFTGTATMRYASANNESTVHTHFNVFNNNWSSVTGVTYSDFGDLKMGSHGPDDYLRTKYVATIDKEDVVVENDNPKVQVATNYHQLNILQKLEYRPSQDWRLSLSGMHSETGDIPRYDRLTTERNGELRSAEWYYGPQKWTSVILGLHSKGWTRLFDEVDFKLSYQKFSESRVDRDFQSELRSERNELVDAYAANLDFLKSHSNELKLFYGLETVINSVESVGETININTGMSNVGPSRYPNSTWRSYAGYVTSSFNPYHWLVVQGGLRLNYFNLEADFSNNLDFFPFEIQETSLNFGSLSGSIGFVVRPTVLSTVSINLSSGFRAPNVDDMGKVFDSEPGAVVVPNTDLEPERAFNVDLGYAQRVSEHFKLDLTCFYTRLNNALVRRDYQLDGRDSILYDGQLSRIQAVQNAAVATVYGVQLGGEVKVNNFLSVSAAINYQKGEEELDDGMVSPSRHAAPLFGSARINYSRTKFSFEMSIEGVGERAFDDMPFGEIRKVNLYALDGDGNPYAPAWYSLNAHFSYEVNNNISTSFGIENITDQRYRTYSSGIAAPGRNFKIAISGKF